MAVTATLVYGTRLYFSTDGSAYSELADCREIGPPGDPDAPEVDVTPLYDSINYRQFKAGLLNTGVMTFKQYYTSARMVVLHALYRTENYWRVVYPDGASFNFRGYLKKATIDNMGNPDDPIMIMGEVKLTRDRTFTGA